MHYVNRVELIGNLGADPELKYTSSNRAVATLSIATNKSWKDKANGEPREHTEWHRVTVWGDQADNASKYLRKGSYVHIVGELKTSSWDDSDGKRRYSTGIVAREVGYLDKKPNGSRAETQAPSYGQDDAPPASDEGVPV